MDEYLNGWMDKIKDGQSDGQTDGKMSGGKY